MTNAGWPIDYRKDLIPRLQHAKAAPMAGTSYPLTGRNRGIAGTGEPLCWPQYFCPETTFLRSLTRRGLRRVKLVFFDAHEGLKAAAAKVLRPPGSASKSTSCETP